MIPGSQESSMIFNYLIRTGQTQVWILTKRTKKLPLKCFLLYEEFRDSQTIFVTLYRDALCPSLWQNTWTSRETHRETPPSAQECSSSGVLHSGSAEYSQRCEVIRSLGSASAAAPNRENLYRVARQRNKVVRSEQNPKNVRYPNSVPFVLKPTHEPFG